MQVTGDELRRIRRDFGMTGQMIADLFCVHATTVSRWESHGSAPIQAEGTSAVFLSVLAQIHRAHAQPKPPTKIVDRSWVGAQIQQALQSAGVIGAISRMLEIYKASPGEQP